MTEFIKVDEDSMTVSARDLHEKLQINTRFNDWFPRMCEYGFVEGSDFYSNLSKTSEIGGRPSKDYNISIDMAKQICMIQRTETGKLFRQYFIDLEKAWNTPEQVFARALKLADQTIDALKANIHNLSLENESMKPKAEFFDAVTDSKDAIPMADVAKVLDMGIGRNKLFDFLRRSNILMANNQPYQNMLMQAILEL